MSENFFLQVIIECYPDGISIVSDRDTVIAANQSARRICKHLTPNGLQDNKVPPQIGMICQLMHENQAEMGDHPIIIEDRIDLDPFGYVRVRLHWISVDPTQPRIMVTLEDTVQGARSRAIAEQRKYGLTNRETEVRLLQLVSCTYETISQKLHITVNTVKKHVKSINMKRSISL